MPFHKIIKLPILQYAVNFFIACAVFMICRVAFVLTNSNFYGDIEMSHYITLFLGGAKYDFAAIFYLSAVCLVMMLIPFKIALNNIYRKIAKYFFIIPVSVGIFANIFDAAFFPFNARRTNFSFFSEFKNEGNLFGIFFNGVIDYWYLALTAAVLIFLLIKFYYNPKVSKADFPGWIYYAITVPLAGVAVYLFLAGIRGSIIIDNDHRPMNMNNANEYIHKSNESAIVLNTPYCILRTMGKKTLEDPQYFSSEEVINYYNPIHNPQPHDSLKNTNVVILILESFGKEYSGFFNHNQGYTPFLDSLYQEGFTFTSSFATGRKSIDAMPSILAGIPYLTDHFFMGMYSNNKVNSIASLLGQNGYFSAFYHGAPNGSMGFLNFSKLAGFNDYYGMTEYCADPAFNAMDDFDGHWAIWDEEFLQYFAKSMGEIPQPFVTACFTATSHNPFRIPERYKERFKEGPQPITKCIEYTDNAIRLFFNKMKEYPWFNNTLFVITADHTNQNLSPEYTTDRNVFSVPILFYQFGGIKKVSEKLFCQTDITPTILDYLNFNKPYIAFGNSYFNADTAGYVVNYSEPLYQISMGEFFLQFNGDKETGFFIPKDDVFLKNNLIGHYPEQEDKMLNILKAEIQQYHVRMINNDLTIGE